MKCNSNEVRIDNIFWDLISSIDKYNVNNIKNFIKNNKSFRIKLSENNYREVSTNSLLGIISANEKMIARFYKLLVESKIKFDIDVMFYNIIKIDCGTSGEVLYKHRDFCDEDEICNKIKIAASNVAALLWYTNANEYNKETNRHMLIFKKELQSNTDFYDGLILDYFMNSLIKGEEMDFNDYMSNLNQKLSETVPGFISYLDYLDELDKLLSLDSKEMISAICSKNSSIVNSIYNCRKKVFEADIEYKRIFREILKDFNFDEKKCTSEEFNDKFSEIERAVRNEAKEKGFEWLADTFYFYNYKLNNSARREKHDFLDINRLTYFHDFSNCMNSVRHLESISDNKEFLSIVKSLYFMVRNDMLSDAMEAATKQYREDNSKYLVDTLNFNKKIKKLENKVSKYEGIIDESKAQNKNLKAELARVSSHVRTLENTIESYSGDNVKELNSIVDTLKQKVEKYKQDSEELKSVITELKEKREKKESENLQLLSKIDKLEKEVDRLNNLNNSLSESKGIENRNKYSIDIKLLLKALSEYKIAIVGGDYIHSYFNEYNNIYCYKANEVNVDIDKLYNVDLVVLYTRKMSHSLYYKTQGVLKDGQSNVLVYPDKSYRGLIIAMFNYLFKNK